MFAGKIRKNQKVTVVRQKDGSTFNDTVVQVLEFDRLAKKEVEEIRAGDVCAVVGIDDAEIGDTICDLRHAEGAAAADHRRADARHGVPRQRLAVRRARKASR